MVASVTVFDTCLYLMWPDAGMAEKLPRNNHLMLEKHDRKDLVRQRQSQYAAGKSRREQAQHDPR